MQYPGRQRKLTAMPLNRVRVAITGVTGLPGVATHYVGTSITDMSAIRTFWDSVKSVFPTGVQIQVPNTGDVIIDDSGQITGSWAGAAQAVIAATGGAGSWNPTTGPMVRWNTPQVVDGRRPIGKTFLVPSMTSVIGTNGQLSSSIVTTVQSAATALIVALGGELKIYHRPKGDPPHGGVACTVTAGTVSNKVMVLRSRRD